MAELKNLTTIKSRMDAIAQRARNMPNLAGVPANISRLQSVTAALKQSIEGIYDELSNINIPEVANLAAQLGRLNGQVAILEGLLGAPAQAPPAAPPAPGAAPGPVVGGYKWGRSQSRSRRSKSKTRKGKKGKKGSKTRSKRRR